VCPIAADAPAAGKMPAENQINVSESQPARKLMMASRS
jgi:hypothetical protein